MPQMAPNEAGIFFPTNQDLAYILGRTDVHSENVILLISFGFPDPWTFRFPDSRPEIARAFSAVIPPRLHGGSTALPYHKVQEIQGSRTIP